MMILYDVAPPEECQIKVGSVRRTPVAPFAGEMSVGGGGGDPIVVNEKMVESAPAPPAFADLTVQ